MIYAQNIIHNIYPLIKDEYKLEELTDSCIVDQPKLKEPIGEKIRIKILERFTPSFFNHNLYERDSLKGRISEKLFNFCEKIGLSKKFKGVDQSSKLCSVILKAERAWLNVLLDLYEASQRDRDFEEKKKIIAHILSQGVSSNYSERLSNDEAKERLNKLVVLTHTFYLAHGKSHTDVTDRHAKGYFELIFPSSPK